MTLLDVGLLPGIIEGEVIEITAQAEGQAAAINQQVRSNTIINVVSEEKIQELPDANAAESIGRLPGVSVIRSGGEASKVVMRGLSDKYSSITIDGVRFAPTEAEDRGFDLSTISQGSLAGVELYKALTPDMDGDAIAGAINLVTKKAPINRTLRLETTGIYQGLNDKYGQYDLSLKYGERFLNNNILGIQLNGNIEKRDRSNDNIEVDNDVNDTYQGKPIYRVDNFNLRYTEEIRDRYGLGVLFDVNTPDGGSIRLNNVFNKTKRDFAENERNYPPPWGDDQVNYVIREREQEKQTYTGSLGGNNYLLGLLTDWGLSYSNSKSEYPFDFEMTFQETSDHNPPPSGMSPMPDELWHGPPEAFIPYAYNNFSKAFLYTAFYRGEETKDDEKDAFLNLAKNYTLGNTFSGQFKLGGKYRNRSRYRDISEQYSPYYNRPFAQYIKLASGEVIDKDFTGTRFENLELSEANVVLMTNFLDPEPVNRMVYDEYNLYPLVNRTAIREWWGLNQNGFQDSIGATPEYYPNPEAQGRFYDVTENISSAYIMNTFNYKTAITFVAGLRMEQENNDYKARYFPFAVGGYPIPPSVIRDTSATHKETIWLPNFHLAIRPVDFLCVRFAAYRALARPDFNHRLPTYVTKAASTFLPGNNWYLGNPGLRAEKAWNYEINTSLYKSKYGLFAVSLFYKDLKDKVLYMNQLPVTRIAELERYGIDITDSPYPNSPFVFWYPFNSNKTSWVKGIEIEHQVNFNFLPGLWRNIVLNYNLTFISSQTYVPYDDWYTEPSPIPGFPDRVIHSPGERKAKMQDQPEFFGNCAIGYDIGGFSARLSLFHQGEFNRSFRTSDVDNIADDFTKLDLSAKQQITSNLAILLNINNLTNVEETESLHDNLHGWQLLEDSEKYGTTVDLGLRINF
jgi:TonB-dependent receptor